MHGKTYSFNVSEAARPTLGVIVLSADETLESDFRYLIPSHVDWYVSRAPSALEVTPETLAAMAAQLAPTAQLFPAGKQFDAIGYACTSRASEIGSERVAKVIRGATQTAAVTDPVVALVAACAQLNIRRLGLLSPYTADVSQKLRDVLKSHQIETPTFGSFNVAEEAVVARIDAASLQTAALDLMKDTNVDALFLSCTNLRTLDVIAPLEQALGKPVLTSNQVLAWHLLSLAGVPSQADAGQLFKTPRGPAASSG